PALFRARRPRTGARAASPRGGGRRAGGSSPEKPPPGAAEGGSAGHLLVDLLALGADRELLRVAVGDPDLPAQRDHRGPGDGALGDLVLLHVVREPLAVPVVVRDVRPGLALRHDLVQHVHGHRSLTPPRIRPLRYRSVQRGVVGKRGDQRQIAALPAQHPRPQGLRGVREDVLHAGREDVPGALLDLRAELALPPAGVAGEHPQPAQPAADHLGRASRSMTPIRPASVSSPSSGRQPSGSSSSPGTPRASPEPSPTGPPANITAGALAKALHPSRTSSTRWS